MRNDLFENMNNAKQSVPESLDSRMDTLLNNLPTNSKKTFRFPASFAVAACILLAVVVFFSATPVGRAAVKSFITWFSDRVFIGGEKSDLLFSDVDDGSYTLDTVNLSNLLYSDNSEKEKCTVTVTRDSGSLTVTSVYDNITIIQSQRTDGTPVHVLYTDYENGEEKFEVCVCDIEFAGWYSENESYIIGSCNGIYYEIHTENVDYKQLTDFISTLVIGGDE